jgi:RNA polymerase sigma factor (sigma-70 family)
MSTSPNPEADLVLQAVAGDEAALSQLLKLLSPDLRARLSTRIGQAFRASLDPDDVLQVSYLEAFLRVRAFKPPASDPFPAFRAWLSRIADNNLTDAIRGLERAKRPDPRKRVSNSSPEDSFVQLVEILGVTSTTPSRVAARHETADLMNRTLSRLPPDYARVIRLHDLQGLAPAGVAAEMGRSTGAIFMLRARAHDQLRELLGSESQFFSNAP